jgi:hypothetical protein
MRKVWLSIIVWAKAGVETDASKAARATYFFMG